MAVTVSVPVAVPFGVKTLLSSAPMESPEAVHVMSASLYEASAVRVIGSVTPAGIEVDAGVTSSVCTTESVCETVVLASLSPARVNAA